MGELIKKVLPVHRKDFIKLCRISILHNSFHDFRKWLIRHMFIHIHIHDVSVVILEVILKLFIFQLGIIKKKALTSARAFFVYLYFRLNNTNALHFLTTHHHNHHIV